MMLSQELIECAARSNLPSGFLLDELRRDRTNDLNHEVCRLRSNETVPGESRAILEREVARLRLIRLRTASEIIRPDPYGHPDLASASIDSNGLIDTNALDQGSGGFAIGDSVFEIAPSLPQVNSSFFAWQSLRTLQDRLAVHIRLDPLMHAPRAEYRALMQKMFVFGRSLTWSNIVGLREESPHRWIPDDPNASDVCFTDAVWTPRGSEIHFRCEECPKAAASAYRASRFFHSIIDRDRAVVTHCDGAVRVFNQEEADSRSRAHVRDAGKVGVRIKLFQVDGDIEASAWTTIVKAFFVWNDDVTSFVDELETA